MIVLNKDYNCNSSVASVIFIHKLQGKYKYGSWHYPLYLGIKTLINGYFFCSIYLLNEDCCDEENFFSAGEIHFKEKTTYFTDKALKCAYNQTFKYLKNKNIIQCNSCEDFVNGKFKYIKKYDSIK